MHYFRWEGSKGFPKHLKDNGICSSFLNITRHKVEKSRKYVFPLRHLACRVRWAILFLLWCVNMRHVALGVGLGTLWHSNGNIDFSRHCGQYGVVANVHVGVFHMNRDAIRGHPGLWHGIRFNFELKRRFSKGTLCIKYTKWRFITNEKSLNNNCSIWLILGNYVLPTARDSYLYCFSTATYVWTNIYNIFCNTLWFI